jgi:hypothetical protein
MLHFFDDSNRMVNSVEDIHSEIPFPNADYQKVFKKLQFS